MKFHIIIIGLWNLSHIKLNISYTSRKVSRKEKTDKHCPHFYILVRINRNVCPKNNILIKSY